MAFCVPETVLAVEIIMKYCGYAPCDYAALVKEVKMDQFVELLENIVLESPEAEPIRNKKTKNVHKLGYIFGKRGVKLSTEVTKKEKEANLTLELIIFGFSVLLPDLLKIRDDYALDIDCIDDSLLLKYGALLHLDSRLRSRPRFISSCSPLAMPSIADFCLFSVIYPFISNISARNFLWHWIKNSRETLRWICNVKLILSPVFDLALPSFISFDNQEFFANTRKETLKVYTKDPQRFKFGFIPDKNNSIIPKNNVRFKNEMIVNSVNSIYNKLLTIFPTIKVSLPFPISLDENDILESNVIDTFSLFPVPPLICWNELPYSLDPAAGELKVSRSFRKRNQVENLIHLVRSIISAKLRHIFSCNQKGDLTFTIVEFGAGGGHLGIVVAWIFNNKPVQFYLPENDSNQTVIVKVILLDRKPLSLARAQKRLEELNALNPISSSIKVEIVCDDVLNAKIETFDLGITLHSCGILTDLSQMKCLKHNASFLLVPCCYGNLKRNCMNKEEIVSFPRSRYFLEQFMFGTSKETYDVWSTGAEYMQRAELDNNESKDNLEDDDSSAFFNISNKRYRLSEACMALIDLDRLYSTFETSNHSCFYLRMSPPECTPKNKIIIGIQEEISKFFISDFSAYQVVPKCLEKSA